jgi:hypothetical protein
MADINDQPIQRLFSFHILDALQNIKICVAIKIWNPDVSYSRIRIDKAVIPVGTFTHTTQSQSDVHRFLIRSLPNC